MLCCKRGTSRWFALDRQSFDSPTTRNTLLFRLQADELNGPQKALTPTDWTDRVNGRLDLQQVDAMVAFLDLPSARIATFGISSQN
jgi:hypothetical protein